MNGKVIVSILVASGVVAGAAMYYLQVYGFYDEVPATGNDDVLVTSVTSEVPEPILYKEFQAIDAESSPLRYRACFETQMSTTMMSETYELYGEAVPLTAPGWFDCFDAAAIGAALEDGTALAFMGTENIVYGFDRVVAVGDDGRGFVWHQINHCGAEVFDGNPPPEGCPTPPERTN